VSLILQAKLSGGINEEKKGLSDRELIQIFTLFLLLEVRDSLRHQNFLTKFI